MVGSPDAAPVTVRDVAARAGVSPMTVSRTLAGGTNVRPEMQELVWKAVAELGYRRNENARSLRRQSSGLIGVAITAWIGRELGFRWIVKGNTFTGSPLLFIAISLLTGIAIGAINGIGVAYFKVASFIMTLVSLTALRGMSYLATNGAPFYLKGPFFKWLSDELWLGIPVSFVLLAFMVLVAHAFLSRTVAGTRLFAIGGNETATLYSGIKTNRYIVAAFALSGVFATVAGLVFTARLKSVEAALAQGFELTAIAIAVIGGVALAGGTGSLWRVLAAAVAFSAGLNLLAMWGVPTWYQNLTIGAVLILAVSLARFQRKS